MKNNPKDWESSAIRLPGVLNHFAVFAGVSLLLVLSGGAGLAALVFTENMGTPSGTTAIAANTFQNSGLAFVGSGDVRDTSTSSGYTGSSGGGNVFLTGAGATPNFIIGSINTVGYSSLVLSFGAFKSTTASTMSELALSYSINGGSTYSALTILPQSGGATWRLISGISLPSDAEGIPDLRLQWVNIDPAGTPNPQFRLDDITLVGTAVPEPSTFVAGALLALPFGVQGVRYLRNRKRA
jgi:hypothetical protein